jgi:hypothetical protein
MSMKTILVPMGNHDAMQSALETALLLARRCDSYIEGFALRWAINEFMVGDVMGGVPLGRTLRKKRRKQNRFLKPSCRNMMCRAQPRRQSRSHSAGWTMRQRGKTSLAAMAAFST